MRIVIAPSNVTLPMPCTKPRAVRLMTATLGKVHAGEARGRDEGWVRSRWCDSDAGGVVAVPAVLARPLASPVAQGDFVGTRSRDPRGGKWCRALGEPRAEPPSAAIRAGPRLPRRGGAPGASCLPLASYCRNGRARRRDARLAARRLVRLRRRRLDAPKWGAPGLAVHPHGFGQHPRQHQKRTDSADAPA